MTEMPNEQNISEELISASNTIYLLYKCKHDSYLHRSAIRGTGLDSEACHFYTIYCGLKRESDGHPSAWYFGS